MRMTHKRQLGLELGLCGHQYTDLRQRRAWEGWPGVRKTTGGGALGTSVLTGRDNTSCTGAWHRVMTTAGDPPETTAVTRRGDQFAKA